MFSKAVINVLYVIYMAFSYKKEPILLLLGDVFLLYFSLGLTLVIRYGSFPTLVEYTAIALPFSLLFLVWILVFFIAGLYEKHTVILKTKLPKILVNAQIANTVIAIVFFYFIPFFTITPKTILFIFLLIFTLGALGWRIYGYKQFGGRRKQKAMIIGGGAEGRELYDEVSTNTRYNLALTSYIDLDTIQLEGLEKEIVEKISNKEVEIIAIDLNNKKVEPLLPTLYTYLFSGIQFVPIHALYEDIFDRIPLSLVKHDWFLENISTSPKIMYDVIKRLMDIVISLILGILSLLFYPFVWVFIKLDDGGEIFSYQQRVGQNNKLVNIYKFRTMIVANDDGKWGMQKNTVTKFGAHLRKTRVDELPQIWNVLKGDISLIGPRPEFAEPVKRYSEEIPYYNVRHIIKPGLSGWAQIYHERHPHHGVDTVETKNKLSYDLYYIKNRSILLDIKIALRTIKTLLSRSGI